MSHAEDLVVQTAGVNDVWHYNEVHLDSFGRDAGDNNSPSFFLPQPLADVMGIKVLAARVPFSWYLVDATNGAFDFTWGWYVSPGVDENVTKRLALPPGSYDSPQALGDGFARVVNANDPSPMEANQELRATFDAPSGTLTFAFWNKSSDRVVDDTYNPDKFFGFEYTFVSDPRSCAFLFGTPPDVPNGRYDRQAPDLSTLSVRTGVVNVAGPNYISLVSNLAGRISPRIHVNGASTPSPALVARVPVDVPAFGIVDYTDPNPGFCFDTGLDQLQRIDLSWRLGNDYDTVLDFNGQPWSVVLQVLTQRDTTAGRTVYAGAEGQARKRLRVQ
jgi:hypothetical protein